MRGRDIIAIVLLILVAVGGQLFSGDSPDPSPPRSENANPRRPDPAPDVGALWDAETRAWLSQAPAPNPNASNQWQGIAPNSVVDIPRGRRSGSGTAFAVAPGKWLTARHVIDGCDDLGLQIGERRAIRVTGVRNHQSADVALLTTRDSPAPFPLARATVEGDDGYMVGFPAGRPGAVHGRKIGLTTLRERGRYSTRERAGVWAERTRVPDRFGSLGGLSGGPLFVANGEIGGVVLAEEPRRGRVIAAEPATMRSLVDVDAGSSAPAFASVTYPRIARELLLSFRVARVLCRVR